MGYLNTNKFVDGLVPGLKPVALITCGTNQKPNIIAISYFGQLSTKLFYIAVRPKRYSNSLIKKYKKFAINYLPSKFVKEVDYCGIVSGRNVNKFKRTGFKKERGKIIPLIKQSLLSIECKLIKTLNMNEHDIFIGKVIAVKKSSKKGDWLFHENWDYYGRGQKVGKIYKSGFSIK
jgi:flavin reductase (DIM6/NTAB) family NADH-FMN oxidoreductase RutF